MKSRSFSLKPFPSTALLPHLEITGDIARSSNKLSISYEISGPLAELVLPAPADVRLRKNGLWEETCFEFFLAPLTSGRYWEFNLSPSGHWNIYHFASFRQGMMEETAYTSLPFSVLIYSDFLQLSLEVELDKILQADQSLKIGISAVIKTVNGRMTFWALTHPGPQPDFHRRDSFIIEL
jgi:hypothetical protein